MHNCTAVMVESSSQTIVVLKLCLYLLLIVVVVGMFSLFVDFEVYTCMIWLFSIKFL